MCSLSIIERAGQRFITMNRDEARSRHEYPTLHLDSPNVVYPRDAQAGGTWFGVNDSGIVLALLNRYQDPQVQGKRSRGWLIPELLTLSTLDAMRGHIQSKVSVADYNPFDLVFIDAKQIYQLSWNGSQASWKTHAAPCFFTSSSLRPLEVIALRHTTFAQWQANSNDAPLDAEAILQQLHWVETADPETAIRMRRAQTHSKSLCQVTLESHSLHLRYWNEGVLNALEPRAMTTVGESVTLRLPAR